MKKKLIVFLEKLESNAAITAVRRGLVAAIPFLLIGAMSLLLRSFPIAAYQSFINSFASGVFYNIFDTVYNATFGLLSVFMTISISISYSEFLGSKVKNSFGCTVAAVAAFGIMSGVGGKDFNISAFGVKGMFTTIICSVTAPYLYYVFSVLFSKKNLKRIYSDGADVEFNSTMQSFWPLCCVLFFFSAVDLLVTKGFGVSSFNSLFIMIMNSIFSMLPRDGIAFGLLFVLISSVLWFFGIHGSDVLDNVSETFLASAADENAALIAAGGEPVHIITKTFIDSFVLIGGCGTAMALLITIFIFSKNKSNRRLARTAALPMVFNINEPMIFGFPIVYNPVMLIPFILTPITSFIISYVSMAVGLVPLTVNSVEWTTPALLSGYIATGSVRGSILQLVIIIAGIFIYAPFIKYYDKSKNQNYLRCLGRLTDKMKESEKNLVQIKLTEQKGDMGSLAKSLAEELGMAIKFGMFEMYYQPQCDYNGNCIGAEALFRWNHPYYGMIYPPLVFQIAEETGQLYELETAIFKRVCRDYAKLSSVLGENAKISINISGKTIQNKKFVDWLEKNKADTAPVWIEITEQMALFRTDETENRLKAIRDLGYPLIIDDFSAGYTTLKYFQKDLFGMVKLDGDLVKTLKNNKRNLDIISSVVSLSDTLGLMVIAEYVEDKESIELLSSVGCNMYQGWYFGKAMPIDDFVCYIDSKTLCTAQAVSTIAHSAES